MVYLLSLKAATTLNLEISRKGKLLILISKSILDAKLIVVSLPRTN